MNLHWVATFVLLAWISPGYAQTGESKRGPVEVPTLANPELLDKGDVLSDAVENTSCSEAYNYQASADRRALLARVKRAVGKVQDGVAAASWFGVPHTPLMSASINAYKQIEALGSDDPAKLQAIAEAGAEASEKYETSLAEYQTQLAAWQAKQSTSEAKPAYPSFPLSPVFVDVLDQVFHDLFDVDVSHPDRKSRYGVEGRKYSSRNGTYITYMAFKRLIDNFDLCGSGVKPTSMSHWKLVRKIDEFKRILARNVDEYIRQEVLAKNPVQQANAMIQQGATGAQQSPAPSANVVP